MYPKKAVNKEHPWEGRLEPFRILHDLGFVGTYQASSHVVDTGDGLVLIDVGYENTVYLLVDNLYRLGYRPQDIRYILLTHWHHDHTIGTRMLRSIAPEAKVVIGKTDAKEVIARGWAVPDVTVQDGDRLTVGKITFRFVETPGHTKGTMSIFFDIEDGGRVYHAGMFGGAGPATLDPSNYTHYEGCREDYLNSCRRLHQETVDLFLGNHCWNNDTDGKGAALRKDPTVNPFINDKEFYTFLDFCSERAQKY